MRSFNRQFRCAVFAGVAGIAVIPALAAAQEEAQTAKVEEQATGASLIPPARRQSAT